MSRLDLKSRKRRLSIDVHTFGSSTHIAAAVYTNGKNWSSNRLAFAWAEPGDCRLSRDPHDGEISLWIGSAAFEVSANEGDRIVAATGHHGLRDERVPQTPESSAEGGRG